MLATFGSALILRSLHGLNFKFFSEITCPTHVFHKYNPHFENLKEKYARENGLFAFETDIYNPGEFEEPDHTGKSEAQIARYRKNSAFLNRVRPAHLRPKRGTQTYSMLFFKKPEFNPKTGQNIFYYQTRASLRSADYSP